MVALRLACPNGCYALKFTLIRLSPHQVETLIFDIDNSCCLWVLSGEPACYGASGARVFAIYENFPV